MKFRTWSGVYLGSKTEDGVKSGYFDGEAPELTRRVLAVYRRRHITPVIESSIRSAATSSRAQNSSAILHTQSRRQSEGDADRILAPFE